MDVFLKLINYSDLKCKFSEKFNELPIFYLFPNFFLKNLNSKLHNKQFIIWVENEKKDETKMREHTTTELMGIDCLSKNCNVHHPCVSVDYPLDQL